MSASRQEIKSYYDDHIAGKLTGFIEGNRRVECAWKTIARWEPAHPRKVLEVGCGIGDISWRMARRWPDADITGLDISPRSVEIARTLFDASNLNFIEGELSAKLLPTEYDLIVLVDVYEHIPDDERHSLNQALGKLLAHQGRIMLSFPTPKKQAWLRKQQPEQIQPVDEDIDFGTIHTLAADSDSKVLLYQEVDVWHEGDYAHAVLGKSNTAELVPRKSHFPLSRKRRAYLSFVNRASRARSQPEIPPRSERLAMVREKLGPESYPV